MGNTKAMSLLTLLYRSGRGTKENFSEAFKWGLKAAENGSLTCMQWTGDAYRRGLGTNMDLEKAIYWYKKGYENGDSYCKKLLSYAQEELLEERKMINEISEMNSN